MLADLQQTLVKEWDAIPQQSDQTGDQHEDEVPGCYDCVWFFNALLRVLIVTLIHLNS